MRRNKNCVLEKENNIIKITQVFILIYTFSKIYSTNCDLNYTSNIKFVIRVCYIKLFAVTENCLQFFVSNVSAKQFVVVKVVCCYL